MLANALLSAALNLALLAGMPFVFYAGYHRIRYRRGLRESARRVGLQRSAARYLWYSLAVAVGFAALFLATLPLEPFTRPQSPQRAFVGLGLNGTSVAMALLYGVITI